jgi:NAD(P)-dependent dehydrogenase (short-subunit alcohol dehydrogenase family)
VIVGKLDGKVAVITGGSSGMALVGAKLFVDEGAHVFISGRRQEALDDAVRLIGRNVTGVQGDAANLDELDRLFDTVKKEKGAVDVLWTSAGTVEQRKLGEITEQHFEDTFGLNARGTLFTVQKALPLFNDGGSIFMDRVNRFGQRTTLERRNGPIRGRFFKTLSEGLLVALPDYKGPDVKNNQKWLFRRRSADHPRSATRSAYQIAHRMLRRSRYRLLTAATSVVRLGSNKRRVVRRDGRGVPH